MRADEGRRSFTRRSSLPSFNQICRKYYTETDIFSSPDGILKLLSILLCVVLSALFVREESGCAGGAGAGAGLAWGAVSAAAAQVLSAASRALHAPLLAPQPCLYTYVQDIIVSTVCGVLLLVAGVLNLVLCELRSVLDYVHGVLAIVIASMLVASVAFTYFSVMRLWDAVAGPAEESRVPPSRDLEV